MTEQLHAPKSAALQALYWRSEILQVMYWLRGEGLGDVVDAQLMERFLGVDAVVGVTYLDRLVEEGYLERAETVTRPGSGASAGTGHAGYGYTLSPTGLEEGAVEFAASFSDLTRPTHGECSADCWCHASVEEAEACAAERREHKGHDHG